LLKERLERTIAHLLSLDIRERLKRKGIPFEERGSRLFFSIPLLGEEVAIEAPPFSFKAKRGRAIEPVEKVLLLEYLACDPESPVTGGDADWIPLEGTLKERAKGAIDRLSQALSEGQDFVRKAILEMGGTVLAPSTFILEPLPRHLLLLRHGEGLEVFISAALRAVLSDDAVVALLKVLQRRVMKRARRMYEEAMA